MKPHELAALLLVLLLLLLAYVWVFAWLVTKVLAAW